MKLITLCKGNDEDVAFRFSELSFECDGETIIAICIESNELRLLSISDMSLKSISEECDSDNKYNFEIKSIDGNGQKRANNSEINIEGCMEYLYENAIEKYECWKSDMGNEGLCEAIESEMAVPLLLAYDYLRCGEEERIYSLLDASDDDSFMEKFDWTFWQYYSI